MNCSNCGKEIDDNAKFCQFCGAKIGKETQKEQSREEIANELNKYRYCPNCKKDTDKSNNVCQHCGFDISKSASKQPSLGESIFGLAAIIIIVLMIRGCNESDINKQPKYTPEQKQEWMTKTNNLMNEAISGGLVTKVDRQCVNDVDDGDCVYYITVNERLWNQFTYEDKENFYNFVRKYSDVRTNSGAAVVKGLYSGKNLTDAFGVKN